MKSVISLFAILAVAVIGCGKTADRVEPVGPPKPVEAKKDAPKVEPKKDAPKVEPKKDAPKVEPKKDEPKKPVLASLDGTYKTACEKGVIKTITIKDDQYEQKTVTFKEKDCTGSSESKTYKSKIAVVASTTKGFTHDVTFDDGETYGASLGAKSLKFEDETVVFTLK